MEQINGYSIGALPVNGLKKVSDLIEYEGPILSHFKDLKNKNYLFYWVDQSNDCNRWLVWKLEDDQLYKYLKGHLSLKELMEEPNKDFVYAVDIDANLKYKNVFAIELTDVPEVYRAEEASTYKYSVQAIYNAFFDKYEANYYLPRLRELALFYTLEPYKNIYSKAVSTIDASNFLRKVTGSFLNFVEEDFLQNFQKDFTDGNRLKKIINQFREILIPRIVEAEYGSFKVGLSTDFIKEVDKDTYKAWQRVILRKYKSEVVDVDYESEQELLEIVAKYSEESRKKIFAPYIEILNNSNYKLKVTDYTRSFTKIYKKVTSEKQNIILPKNYVEELENETKFFYNLILESGPNQDLKRISGKTMQENTLFSEILREVDIPLNEIKVSEATFILKKPLMIHIRIEGREYSVTNNEFEINILADSREDAINLFQKQFSDKYFELIRNNDSSKESIIFKAYDNIVDRVAYSTE